MTKLLKDNGLTIALLALFLLSLLGHWLAGVQFQNEELVRHGQQPIGTLQFLSDPLFLATVFENWESEFLQMSAYVVLTAFLFQRGSAESADPDESPRDGELAGSRAGRMGLATRWVYAHSLGMTLFVLFLISFALHWYFSAKEAAGEAVMHGEPAVTVSEYLWNAQLWFESFQNWQSEFLSTAVLVVLSIWLRQKESPESKPVDAPDSQTGA